MPCHIRKAELSCCGLHVLAQKIAPVEWQSSAHSKHQIIRAGQGRAKVRKNLRRLLTYRKGAVAAFGFRLIEVSLVDRLTDTERAGFDIDVAPAECQQLPDTQAGEHEQERHRTCGFIQNRNETPHLLRREHCTFRPMLATREPGFERKIVCDVAPFFSRTQNL